MGLTLLKRALVSGGLSMTYKVHNPRATRRCGTRQHFSHGLLLWGRFSLLIICGSGVSLSRIGAVCANGVGRMWTISFYIVLCLWNSGPWCLVCLGSSGLFPELWWIFFAVGCGIGGGIVLSWYGRWFLIVWFGVFEGSLILVILRIQNNLFLSSRCFSFILYLIGLRDWVLFLFILFWNW